MKFPRQAKIFRGQLDVAPFAGVFFLLTIFLLLHSSFVLPTGVQLQLPDSGDWPGNDVATVTVAIDANKLFYFEHQVITEKDLQTRLTELKQRTSEPLTLVVLADKSVPLETFMRLQRIAHAAGITSAVLAGHPPEREVSAKLPR
ncbi:MAG: biopolymer transporter ExbD [Verrucomicrobia bacterium]|nr:biopolymer transporter ExbD [Verrucomicrobiota bacterium]